MKVWVDHSHMKRRASGIERVTAELFGYDSLQPVRCIPLTASAGKLGVFLAQMLTIPARAVFRKNDVFVFPGFPPSLLFTIFTSRSVLYVHDLFLLTRRADLNVAGKCYMAPLFALAIRNFRYFLTNCDNTAAKLRERCRPDASIVTYRPRARNVFGLDRESRPLRPTCPEKIKIVMIGTVEPRKNFLAAERICKELRELVLSPVELHVIGRRGWGGDFDYLSKKPNVFMHGFLPDAGARDVLNSSDFYLCTSHDEGLGLPLLEVQYGGIPVIAPDQPVFREVLGASGTFIDPGQPKEVAQVICRIMSDKRWRVIQSDAAAENIERWNKLAESDRQNVVRLMSKLILKAA